MQRKHSVRAKNGHFAGATGAQEVAETATSFILIGTFVDDGMGRRGVDDRLPRPGRDGSPTSFTASLRNSYCCGEPPLYPLTSRFQWIVE